MHQITLAGARSTYYAWWWLANRTQDVVDFDLEPIPGKLVGSVSEAQARESPPESLRAATPCVTVDEAGTPLGTR